jgi:hypothetical protein
VIKRRRRERTSVAKLYNIAPIVLSIGLKVQGDKPISVSDTHLTVSLLQCSIFQSNTGEERGQAARNLSIAARESSPVDEKKCRETQLQ